MNSIKSIFSFHQLIYFLKLAVKVSLCSASFCTPRANLPVTPGVSSLPTFALLFLKEPSSGVTNVFSPGTPKMWWQGQEWWWVISPGGCSHHLTLACSPLQMHSPAPCVRSQESFPSPPVPPSVLPHLGTFSRSAGRSCSPVRVGDWAEKLCPRVGSV